VEPAEEGGQWWLPENPHVKVPGVFRIDDKGRSQLTLIGELRDRMHGAVRHDRADGSTEFRFIDSGFDRSGRYARVVGRTQSSSYTLVHGLRTRHSTNLIGGLASETVLFDQVFRGIRFEHGEQLAFDRITVDMQWLTHWVAHTALKETHEWVNDRPNAVTLRGSGMSSRRVRLGGGLTVYLHHSVGLEGDRITHRGLTQRFVFELRSTSVLPLDTLMATPAHLQALVSIGTDRPAGYEGLVLNHPHLTQGPPTKPRQYRRPIDYLARWSARDDEVEPPEHHGMPFTLRDLGGLPAVGRWLPVANRYQHQLSQVMATRYNSQLVSDCLINRVAALEGFHKLRNSTQLSLKQRLIECGALAGTPFQNLVTDIATWAQVATRERNHIGHGSDPGGFEANHTLLVADGAYWLFVFCLLREMDAPEAVFDRIGETPTFRWLRHNLAEALC